MLKRSVKDAHIDAARHVIFQRALEPMEAAVLAARERRHYGVLAMIPRAFEAAQRTEDQRAKIWVR